MKSSSREPVERAVAPASGSATATTSGVAADAVRARTAVGPAGVSTRRTRRRPRRALLASAGESSRACASAGVVRDERAPHVVDLRKPLAAPREGGVRPTRRDERGRVRRARTEALVDHVVEVAAELREEDSPPTASTDVSTPAKATVRRRRIGSRRKASCMPRGASRRARGPRRWGA